MKVVVAPDSFKGSLTQMDASILMKNAIQQVDPLSNVVMKPMADGGEGTLDAMLNASSLGQPLAIQTLGPLGDKIDTKIGIVNNDTAIIEIATIAGLPLIPEYKQNPLKTTTYGVGQAIRIALDKGLRKFIIGLGGSATNDGGFGMLIALGAMMRDSKGQKVGIFGKNIMDIDSIHLDSIDPRLGQCDFQIACDVDNPLYGKDGASYIFGPQKGAEKGQIYALDNALKKYSNLMQQTHGQSNFFAKKPGAGAAGGLGFGFMILGAKLVSGARLIAETMELETEIENADLVITGEGKSDSQTLYGKAPGHVAELANTHHVPVILISGEISNERELLAHFTEVHQLIYNKITVKQAMKEAKVLLFNRTKGIFEKYKLGRN